MVDLTFIKDLVLIFLVALLGGFLAKKLKFPLLTGYVLGGFLVGLLGSAWLDFGPQLSTLAEIGVALLMFTLGIEFSFSRLTRVSKVAVWGGTLQILATIILGLLLLPRFGFDFYSSLFLAAVFSLSSTAIIVKILTEKGEIDTLHGEILVGWLLVQDLAVLPMMLILPTLAKVDNQSPFMIIWAIIRAAVLLYLVVFLGKKVVPYFLTKIAETKSRELLLLSVVSLSLLVAFSATALGLSFVLGAFLAGLLVATCSQNQAIFAEVRPLRDLFSVTFFVSLGLLLKPSFIILAWGKILGLGILVMLGKFLLVAILILWLGYHTKTALLVAAGLVQVGEFSFVLARAGQAEGIITEDVYFLILSLTLLTMMVTPGIFNFAPVFYKRLKTLTHRYPPFYNLLFARFDHRLAGEEELPLSGHVVICGHGRVGKPIRQVLELAQIPYVVVDFNQAVVKELADRGVNVVYGDPADFEVLDWAQVDKAAAVVIAVPDRHSQELVIQNSLRLKRDIPIICRSHFEEDRERLLATGAHVVVQPEFEASLAMVQRLLMIFGKDSFEISHYLKKVKKEHGF